MKQAKVHFVEAFYIILSVYFAHIICVLINFYNIRLYLECQVYLHSCHLSIVMLTGLETLIFNSLSFFKIVFWVVADVSNIHNIQIFFFLSSMFFVKKLMFFNFITFYLYFTRVWILREGSSSFSPSFKGIFQFWCGGGG